MADVNWGILGQTPEFKPVQGGVGGAIAEGISTGNDMQYKQALSQQAQAAAKLQNIQAAVAQAGLIANIMGTVHDDKTNQYAINSLNKLGIDTSEAPTKYDPSYVAQKRALSDHYLEAVQTQANVSMKQLQQQMTQAQMSMAYAMKGLNMPLPQPNQDQIYQPIQGLNQQQQMPQQGGQQHVMGMQIPQQQSAQPLPQQMPAQAPMNAPQPMPGQPSAQQVPQQQGGMQYFNPASGMSYPSWLSQQQQTGELKAKSFDALRTSILNQAKTVPETSTIIANARDAISHGISPGKYTGVFREWLSPSYADMLDKSTAYLLQQQIKALAGTGNRVMAGELQQFTKGLPQNLTMKQVNERIIDMIDLTNQLADKQSDAFQKLQDMGVTDPIQMENVLRKTFTNLHAVNQKTGQVNLQNMKYYDKALDATVNNKPMISDEDIKATAQKRGISEQKVREFLQQQGLL